MRLLICAGGTGGGVYPALAVLQALEGSDHVSGIGGTDHSRANDNEVANHEYLWVGSERGMEVELIEQYGIPIKTIPAAGLHGVGMRAFPGNSVKLINGYRASKRILNDFKPDTLLFTGGYLAVPMAIAARNLPSLVFVPDIEPGMALKSIINFADMVAVSTESSVAYISEKKDSFVSGYPTRNDLKKWDKAEALATFQLSTDLPVLLVFGGSKGARSINNALLPLLPEILSTMQVIHISGSLDWDSIEKSKHTLTDRTEYAENYSAFPYLHEKMGAALAAADLVVSRAGASCLGEYPLFGIPAILVPYPHAWAYQLTNANYLKDRGAAVVLRDEKLDVALLNTIQALMNDCEKREEMGKAMRALLKIDAAETIANQLLTMSSRKDAGG